MKIEWEGKLGPAFLTGISQIIVMLVGGAIVWTQLQDKVEITSKNVESVRTAVGNLKTSLAASQTDRAAQSERLGRVETAISYISGQIQRVEARFDGSTPTAPALPPPPKP